MKTPKRPTLIDAIRSIRKDMPPPSRVEQPRKGKLSYVRRRKHRSEEE